jgi:hypothetical protein
VTIDKAPRDPATPSAGRITRQSPPPEQIARWFGHPDARGLGLVLSPQLPGRLACLDFDDPDEYRELDYLMRERDDVLSRVWERLHGWHETTSSGGVHLLFTIEDPPAIAKISKLDTLGIGKASHCVMAPTPGYRLASPDRNPERLTAVELELLTDVIQARHVPHPAPRPSRRAAPIARLPSMPTSSTPAITQRHPAIYAPRATANNPSQRGSRLPAMGRSSGPA